MKILCLLASVYFLGIIGLASVRDIRIELHKKIHSLSIHYFHKERTGTFMSRAINDGEIIGKLLSVQFNEVLVDIFYVITHIGFLFWISWKMTLVLLLLVPILAIPIDKLAIRIRKAATRQQKSLAELIGQLYETISGIRAIRAFAMEDAEYRRFRMTNQRLTRSKFLGHYLHQVGPIFTDFIAVSIILSIFVWGAYEISQDKLSLGLFFIYFFALFFVMRPIKRLSIAINLLSASTSAAARIFEVLDEKEDVKEKENPLPLYTFSQSIRYENVSYKYPNGKTLALDNINLEIKVGENIALVGSSGAGKSTLLDLLPRLYDVQSGSIKIDNKDIRDINLSHLRNIIGVMSQDITLFNTNIAENIAYGNSQVSLKEIQKVAQQVNAHEFIEKLDKKYDTIIGERGVMLSGGQKQRIAMARVLLIDPPIIILDEATSNLDNQNEHLVQESLEKICSNRTVLTIAHRLSSILRAQKIYVLEKGRIVEEGSHKELLAKKKTYYNLYKNQILKEGISKKIIQNIEYFFKKAFRKRPF